MRRIILPSVVCQLYNTFSTLSHKGTICDKNINECKISVLISSTHFVRDISHSKKKEGDIIKMSSGLHVKCPLFCLILMKLEFSR